jgi:methyl-accepting chemotaxis protein
MNIITQEITTNMNEMAEGAENISSTVYKVNELSIANNTSIESLLSEVNKFKV